MLSLVENVACGRDIAKRQALIGGKLYRQKPSPRQNCTLEFATLHKRRESGGYLTCIKDGKVPQSYQVWFCLIL